MANRNSYRGNGLKTEETLRWSMHTDHLKTPRLVADSAGAAVWQWEQQEPFGVNVADENPSGFGAFEFPLRFLGQYADKETNLSQNGMRDFDPALGRFAIADPLGLRHHLSPYSYANLNPLSFLDRTGEAATLGWCAAGPFACAAGATAAVGALVWAQSQSAKKSKNPTVDDVPTSVIGYPANDPCKPDRDDCPTMQAKLLVERKVIVGQLTTYPGLKLGALIALFNNKVASHNAFCPSHPVDPI